MSSCINGFSERELTFTFAICYRPSVCRLSFLCLSICRLYASVVCNVRAPYSGGSNFGWRPLLQCRAVTLPRLENRWNLQGCPKLRNRSQPLVDRSSPYYEDMWRYWCLTRFFSDCQYMPQLRRYSRTNLWDGAEMAIFCVIFASCISSKPRAAHFRPAF